MAEGKIRAEERGRMICETMAGDNRFEIIAKAKQAILEGTNIDTSEDEMKVLDNFLFRCWQMGWLDKYDDKVLAWMPLPKPYREDGESGSRHRKSCRCHRRYMYRVRK